jgi:hypothetical protein
VTLANIAEAFSWLSGYRPMENPLKFGIAKGQANEFVTQRGLKVISDLGSEELAQKYLVRSDGTIDGNPTAYERIMHASVDR